MPRDFTSNDSVVYMKHFEKDSTIFVDKVTSKDEAVAEYERKYPKLSDETYLTSYIKIALAETPKIVYICYHQVYKTVKFLVYFNCR